MNALQKQNSGNDEQWLSGIYLVAHKIPGWLPKVETMFALDPQQVRYLEFLDDQMMASNTEHDKEVAKMKNEWDWGLLSLDTDEEKIMRLSHLIADVYARYAQMEKDGFSYLERRIYLLNENVEGMERLRNKIRARQVHKAEPSAFSVTEYEIAKAREYPIGNLVGETKMNKIICPFHEDTKPSMYVKNGWAYCFSCGESCDSIRWMMDVKNYKFFDAVKYLQGE